ncbi:hypothetical protein [Chromobacterium amazonense]|uniref:hypothetical protein n=1 Tax=Chromobacterium amazonense TaxID=1382803 RepID=UPI0011B1FE91|nr:hypothetical protein [Chromobacterium amazonense]
MINMLFPSESNTSKTVVSDVEMYRKDFSTIVTFHIQNQLSIDEWNLYLKIAMEGTPYDENIKYEEFESIEDRVCKLTCKENLSPLETLSAPKYFESVEIIGRIKGVPVFYYAGKGVYQWSNSGDGESLTFWATHPAYPPGWG